MKLLTDELIAKFAEVGSQDGKGEDAIVYAKFFDPCGSWNWFMTEYDPKHNEGFGLVQGFEEELGYFSIKELEEVKGQLGLGIERDIFFTPRPLRECRLGYFK